MKSVAVAGDRLLVKFGGRDLAQDEFDRILGQVKRIPGRVYDPQARAWKVPKTPGVLDLLKRISFDVSGVVPTRRVVSEIDLPADLSDRLRPFQRTGVQFLLGRDRALLGDEQGLGKTVQAIGAVRCRPGRTLVICPSILKINWEREIRKWTGEDAYVLRGMKAGNLDWTTGKWLIVNFDVLEAWTEALKTWDPEIVIIDECQKIKNLKAKRTKAVRALTTGAKRVFALSGTPVTSRPAEFYSVLSLLDPGTFGNWWRYAFDYCGAKHNGFGWEFKGATNIPYLHEVLTAPGGVMLRRLKEDVLAELPRKQRTVIPIEIDRKVYDEAERLVKENLEMLDDNGRALAQFSHLRIIAAEAKIKAATEWIEDFLEGGGKLVVFAWHHQILDKIAEEFPGISVVVDGRSGERERQDAVDRFQTDPECRLFIGNIQAAGTGLTLTAASSVAFVELGWTPGDHDQAEDRVHRIGQEEAVNVYYLVAEKTIEDEMLRILDRKREVLAGLLDGQAVAEDVSLLRELLKVYKKGVG